MIVIFLLGIVEVRLRCRPLLQPWYVLLGHCLIVPSRIKVYVVLGGNVSIEVQRLSLEFFGVPQLGILAANCVQLV
jgi:hypothetical protein